jgi:hypothetical protein
MADRERTLEEELEELKRRAGALGQAQDADADDLVTIKLHPKKLIENLDAVERALIDGGALVFQRDRILVTIGTVKAIDSDKTERVYQAIVPLNVAALREIVAGYCLFLKFDKRTKKWEAALPADYLVQGILSRPTFQLPVLKGIVNHPHITSSGEIVTTPGYDKGTGIYFDPLGVEFPPLPEITCENARELATSALARIETLFHTFPFVDEASRSVALSQLMTGISRRAMKSAPVHVGDASVRGSGKSMITRITSIVAIGKPAPALNQGHTSEEFEKRLASMLLAGYPIINIDNCSAIVDGDLLNSIATEETVALRILGLSRIVEITTGALVCPNGNNIVVRGDAIRRCVKYRLDPGVERPETLQFEYDPIADAFSNRAEIVIAILTILRARHVAKLKPPAVWQSFEDWSNTVRSALIWLGKEDPCQTVEDLQSDDPELAEIRAVYSEWWEHVGRDASVFALSDEITVGTILSGYTTTVAEVIKTATRKIPKRDKNGTVVTNDANETVMIFEHPEFRSALLDVAGDQWAVHSKKLGQWLKARLDRRVRVETSRETKDKGRKERWVVRITRQKDLSRDGVAVWQMIGELESFEEHELPF